ncbi:copper amine oxidase N-terminal domain-containing protein [Peptococcus simiae]|uniref:copper amine oxidase N-terminal domain-containing protein n=1 Tax=Peptococcus simiae TaxID=1643805 RepID=UPI00398028CE
MLRKKLIAGLTAFTLLFSTAGPVLGPEVAQAADETRSVNIYGFSQGTDKVVIFTKGMKVKDVYRVTLRFNNGTENRLDLGEFTRSADGMIELSAEQYPILKDLRAGDKLIVDIIPADRREKDLQEVVNLDGVKVKPESMKLEEATIIRDKGSQDLNIRFDRAYKPSDADFLQLIPYDKDGKRLDRRDAVTYAITEADLRTRAGYKVLPLRLTPAKGAAYYEIQYITGNAIVDDLTLKVPVGGDFTHPTALVLEYPSSKVKVGETVQPRVYLKNKDGETMDVSATAIFTYTGSAMEAAGRAKGGFTIKNDDKYVGEKVVVTAVAGGRTDTQTLTVVDQSGSDKPWNVPGVPRGKTGVIMNINSTDMLINGQKKTIDAPAIIQSNRTFVPLRAVAEAFGAKVDFDQKDYRVTIRLDGNTIVMPIGSKNYTVNGQTKAMDVAPYIQASAGRTMIPVRYAAEAMGFKVSTTQNNDGTTASVIFKNY